MDHQRKIAFLITELPRKILEETPELDSEGTLSEVTLTTPKHLDGFMSTIHKLNCKYRNRYGSDECMLNLIVKVMKGSDEFRQASLSKIQFMNEIYIYTKVLPVFEQLVAEADCGLFADWCPKVYFGASGFFPQYSDQYETILVLEDISTFGYKAGPRVDLGETHLLLMVRNIATFHACTYALRIQKDSRLKTLIDGIIPLNFIDEDKTFNSYEVLLKFGVDRLYRYLGAHPELVDTEGFREDFEKFRASYGTTPIQLMQNLLKPDEVFSVILHGDYNRNNVMFLQDACGAPVLMKMLDFQENRYATPAIDLTFFMYMSMTEELRNRCWDELIDEYHNTLLISLAAMLKVQLDDPSLDPYRYEPFMEHFKRHALYGLVVTLHFLPWMMCPEDECEQLSYHFARDINSPEMAHLTRVCGGEAVDKRLLGVFRHASSKGYFAFINE